MGIQDIAVIIYKTNSEKYIECLRYINTLSIPDNFCIKIITVEGRGGKAEAYNQGLLASNAKYKIYLDENTQILQSNILIEMLKIFSMDATIGMVGVAGTKVIPTNAICRKAVRRTGKAVLGILKQMYVWEEFEGPFKEVMALDDSILMTQYDLPWREDMFFGDSFYDTAQCIEFHRKGYKTVVLHQDECFVQDLRDNFSYDKQSQQFFLDVYSKDIYPKVLIMILTYNRPEYFRIALESVLQQTYRNLEIVITDDSTNELTNELVQPYLTKDSRIHYYRHFGYTSEDNWKWARKYMQDSSCEYVNWLLDDDVFDINKISRMINYYLEDDDISLVTSYRQVIDYKGDYLQDICSTQKIMQKTGRIDGEQAGCLLLRKMLNYIGEVTTVLIKKDYLLNNDFGWYMSDEAVFLPDVSTWLRLLSQGDMIYIVEPLSYFRLHEEQAQNSMTDRFGTMRDWASYIRYAYQNHKFLKTSCEYQEAIVRFFVIMGSILSDVISLHSIITEDGIASLEATKQFLDFFISDESKNK